MSTQQTYILAAGGTGGHLFPAQALGEALQAQGHRVVLITDRRFAQFTQAFAGMEVRTIPAGGLQRNWRIFISLKNIISGIVQAARILQSLKPAAVIGFGGYPSFPTMMAAGMLRVPTIIHEQNSLLGRTNRFIAGFVSAIATSFPETGLMDAPTAAKATHTGNPVRAGIRALRTIPYASREEGGSLRVLVMGGSQGASVFSQVMPAAIGLLPEALRAQIQLDQQCRAADLDSTRAAFAAHGFHADLAPFFTDVPARLAAAHVVISRAGASSVCEFTVAGRPSVLVPLPSSADNHQHFNALAVEKAGGAWLVPQPEFTPQAVADLLQAWLRSPAALAQKAAAAHAFGQPDATDALVALVQRVARAGVAE